MTKMSTCRRISVVDSHTGGEPTRVVVTGGPDLGRGPLSERRDLFRQHFDAMRAAIIEEPRGSDVMVGALLVEPTDPTCTAGVIFFNNVGYLGMCGHGTIGLITTLFHLGRIDAGVHLIETPVGIVKATLHENGEVSIQNVPSYRIKKDLEITVANIGTVTGDVAWGGNWFFLSECDSLAIRQDNIDALTDYAWRVRQAVNAAGYPEVDHIELFGPPTMPGADSKNFVLCPGRAYDRSPCGTGTSAKLACLAADGKLAEGDEWLQESIIGSIFKGSFKRDRDQIIPFVTGSAYISAETTLMLDKKDPFCWGIRV